MLQYENITKEDIMTLERDIGGFRNTRDDKEFKSLKYNPHESGNKFLVFDAVPLSVPAFCPKCQAKDFVKNGSHDRQIQDLNYKGYNIYINIKGTRYKCKNCGKTFLNTFDCVESNSHMTVRLKDKIRSEAKNKTFTEIAAKYGIHENTVKVIFGEYILEQEAKRKLYSPEIIEIATTCIYKKKCPVIADVIGNQIIEVLADDSKESLVKYFQRLPEHQNIKTVVIEMKDNYKEAIAEALPDAEIVVEKNYVMNEVNNELEYIRQKNIPKKKSRDFAIPAHVQSEVLSTSVKCMDDDQKETLYAIQNKYPDVAYAYYFKEAIRQMYDTYSNTSDAKKFLNDFWKQIPVDCASLTVFEYCIVENWINEICNYFDYINRPKVRKSPFTHRDMCDLIKYINLKGHGYQYDVFRAKLLFSSEAARLAVYRDEEYTDNIGEIIFSYMKSYKESKVLVRGTGSDIPTLLKMMKEGRF